MERPGGIAIAAAVGAAAVAAPIWISLHLAWRQSVTAEESRVRFTANDILHHTDEAVQQYWAAYGKLRNDHLTPCSAAEIDLMRSIDMGSTYIQAVGRIEGDTLTCTSLGTAGRIPVGPAKFKNEYGADTRLGVQLPVAGNHPLNIVSGDGVAILYDPMLFIDTPMEGRDVSVAVFAPSEPQRDSITSMGSGMRPEWLKVIAKGSESIFVDAGYIVCAMRPRNADLEIVAAVPMSYAARRERQIALILVPFGLVCGALLAWANVYVSRKRLSLAGILRAGVRRREFYVEYQPVVELATGRWVGAEALVRWRRGKRIMRPDMFIPIAEETGLITGITECVFEVVSRDLPQILAVDSEFSVAINLSAADLGSEKTLRLVNRTLKESGAKPDNLEVEAMERGFLQGDEARAVITAIRERGVAVAIDDFGTGYSSLSRLQELPLDVLKIDKSFVDAVGTDGVTSQVVLHIIEMAQSLKLDLVAEGVETEDQAAFLRENGVTYAQGWLFGKPMAVTSLCTALATRAARIDEVCA